MGGSASKADAASQKRIAELEAKLAEFRSKKTEDASEIDGLKDTHDKLSENQQQLLEDLQEWHESHSSEVADKCSKLCKEFYKNLNQLIEQCIHGQNGKRSSLLAEMHAKLQNLDSLLEMHGKSTEKYSMGTEKATQIVQDVAVHVMCMWELAKDVLDASNDLKSDEVYQLLDGDVNTAREFLKNGDSVFSPHQYLLEQLDSLEKNLFKFADKCNSIQGPVKECQKFILNFHSADHSMDYEVYMLIECVMKLKLSNNLKSIISMDASTGQNTNVSEFKVEVTVSNANHVPKAGIPSPPPPPPLKPNNVANITTRTTKSELEDKFKAKSEQTVKSDAKKAIKNPVSRSGGMMDELAQKLSQHRKKMGYGDVNDIEQKVEENRQKKQQEMKSTDTFENQIVHSIDTMCDNGKLNHVKEDNNKSDTGDWSDPDTDEQTEKPGSCLRCGLLHMP